MTMKSSTFTCDGCEANIEVPEGEDPQDFGVSTITMSSKVLEEPKTVHLDEPCLENYMDGTLSGNDLFLQD
jgi:hypothetical protein